MPAVLLFKFGLNAVAGKRARLVSECSKVLTSPSVLVELLQDAAADS